MRTRHTNDPLEKELVTAIPLCAPAATHRALFTPAPLVDPTPDAALLRLPGLTTESSAPILIIDDEHGLRENCARVLAQLGNQVVTCGSGDEALALVRRRTFDVVFVELRMSRVDGLTLMRAILRTSPGTRVIVMAADPSAESGINALREGAWDYLPKPFSAVQLQVLAGSAMATAKTDGATRQYGGSLHAAPGRDDSRTLLGSAPAFLKALEIARRVAPTDASVFVTGESGCGKELLARYIHDHSRRSGGAFVAVNCGAIPEALLESEMFGHERGSFTGAFRQKAGLVEAASGGTLFLDELLEMSRSAQTKLLRVLQDGVVRRVGSVKTDATVNVRFISATNADLDEALARSDVRADLLYRLRVVPIHLPALRDRPEDIPLLARHFLATFWRSDSGAAPRLSRQALESLMAHPWPGNVRELRNVIERVAVFAQPGGVVHPAELFPNPDSVEVSTMYHEAPARPEDPSAQSPALEDTTIPPELGVAYHHARERMFREFQIQYMTSLMSHTRGNMSAASRIAGVGRATLYRILERVGLERELDPGASAGTHGHAMARRAQATRAS